jgi:hypothetical protein
MVRDAPSRKRCWFTRSRTCPTGDTTAAVTTEKPEPVTPPLPVPVSGDADTPESIDRTRRWSFGLLAVAILRLADALNLTLHALQIGGIGASLPRINDVPLTHAIELTVAVLTVVGVIGLLGGRRWGWVLTMLIVGLGLVFDLIQYLNGLPVPIALLLHVLAAFYLNQRSVRSMAADVLHDPEMAAA